MREEPKLLPAEPEPLLLDRPAEERLQEELERAQREKRDGGAPVPRPSGEPQQGAGKHVKHDEEPKPSRKWLVWAGLVALVLIGILLVVGLLPRLSRNKASTQHARKEAEALPQVDVVKVRNSPRISQLLLPGNITPVTEAPIYARATGYIVRRFVDIGDTVRSGQLLALIDAPDLDQQVAQGRSQVAQAKQQLGQTQAALQNSQAQLQLASVTWDRYRKLVIDGAVSRQDADTQKANFDTAGANVNSSRANVRAAEDNVRAAEANLERLIALQSYKQVRAPFAGVITARNIDVGSYISTSGGPSGSTSYASSQQLGSNSGTNGQNGEIFRIAQIERLRILVNVPQTDAPSIRAGQKADVLVAEYHGRRFPGDVTRTASALDPSTRTLLTEVQIDNRGHTLLPGMYAEVQFANPRTNPPFLVPGDSLISRPNGMYLATLRDPDPQKLDAIKKEKPEDTGTKEHNEKPKQIHLQKVDVGRDYGTDTEITGGLQGWERVATNPSDLVYEGALVLPTAAKRAQGATPAGGPTDKAPGGSGGETSAGARPKSANSNTGTTPK